MSNVAYATAGTKPTVPGGAMASQFSIQKQGNQALIVPHTQTFSSLYNWMSRTYRFRFDEAVANNYANAKAMLNDAFIQGLFRNRIGPVAKSDFRVISKGPGASKKVDEFYKSLLMQIPLWHEFRRNMLMCAWHGRFGIQMAFDDQTFEGRKFEWEGKAARSISHWLPHMGDKITFTFDMFPCIRVSPMYVGEWQSRFGATVLQPNDPRINREAVGYRWTEEGPVVVLDNPAVRKQFAISIFEIQDAPWDDPQLAGGIRGIGLRHYAYWNWNHRQDIVSWAMLHLEDFGAGGYTVVGYDGPEGLKKAQATFDNPETRVLYVPIVPGNDERVTDMVTRLTPAGAGNDAIYQWANDYFDSHLIVLFLGHPLNMQAQSTGMNSDQGSHAKDILSAINKGDAEILDTTMSHEVLTRLKEENDPNGQYTLEFESAIRAVDKEAGMTRIKALFDMGAKIPSDYAYMLADVPPLEEGDPNYLQSVQYRQQAQEQAMGEAGPPMGTDDTSYLERGANHQDDVSGIFRAGKPTGTSLQDARRKLEAKGVPSEDVLATLAQAVASGKLIEHDDDGGVSYSPGKGKVAVYSSEVDPSAKWSEEDAPRAAGGRRWRNVETGEVRYDQPSAGRHVQVGGEEHAADKLNRAQGEGVGVVPGKGVATSGIHQRILSLAKEGGASLKGEGVLAEVMNADKRLKKAEAVQLAGQLGLKISRSTSKTAALAHIEYALRLKAGNAPKPGEAGRKAEEKPGRTMTGKESSDPVAENKPSAATPDSQSVPRGNNDNPAEADKPALPGDDGHNPTVSASAVDDAPEPEAIKELTPKQLKKAVKARARALHRQAKDSVDEHNAVVKQAVDKLSEQYGKQLRRNSPEWNNFEDDHTSMAGFDEMAQSVIADNPGVFRSAGTVSDGQEGQEFGEHYDNVEKLWDMLRDGKQPYPDKAEYEHRAIAEAQEAGYDIESLEEADTSFDFGANVPGESHESIEQSNTVNPEAEAGAEAGLASSTTTEAGAALAGGTDSNPGDAAGSSGEVPATAEGNTTGSADIGTGVDAGTEAGASLADAAVQDQGGTGGGDTEHGSQDAGARGVSESKPNTGMPDGQGSGNADEADDGFMAPEKAGEHQADDIPGYAGQTFTNDRGASVEVRKAEDGTWSVGSQEGLSQAGAARVMNRMKAVKAQGLFGDDVTAQAEQDKPKEKLEWAKPAQAKELPDLPGMKDSFAPGMFGQAANQKEVGKSYEDFSKEYKEQFAKMNKYKPGTIGNDEAVEAMAKLSDENPEHMERIEGESADGDDTQHTGKPGQGPGVEHTDGATGQQLDDTPGSVRQPEEEQGMSSGTSPTVRSSEGSGQAGEGEGKEGASEAQQVSDAKEKDIKLPEGVRMIDNSHNQSSRWRPGEKMTLFRASSATEPRFSKMTHYSENTDDAKAYLDNPGYGGEQLYAVDVEPKDVLDLTGESNPMRYLADKLAEDHGLDYDEAHELYERIGMQPFVYEAWENDSKIKRMIKEKYKWIRHDAETFPEGATTWVSLDGIDTPE